jgi:hypothetical protein
VIAAAAPGHLTISTMSTGSWLYYSADNGRTWRTVVIHGHPDLGDMRGHLLLTGNGGQTWHVVRF